MLQPISLKQFETLFQKEQTSHCMWITACGNFWLRKDENKLWKMCRVNNISRLPEDFRVNMFNIRFETRKQFEQCIMSLLKTHEHGFQFSPYTISRPSARYTFGFENVVLQKSLDYWEFYWKPFEPKNEISILLHKQFIKHNVNCFKTKQSAIRAMYKTAISEPELIEKINGLKNNLED